MWFKRSYVEKDMNIFVGSLSYEVTEEELKAKFEECGTVTSANIIKDRETGRSKGFGFIEMDNDSEAKKAIEELNGIELSGRTIVVNEARKREERPRRSFGGGGGRSGNQRGGFRGNNSGGGRRY